MKKREKITSSCTRGIYTGTFICLIPMRDILPKYLIMTSRCGILCPESQASNPDAGNLVRVFRHDFPLRETLLRKLGITSHIGKLESVFIKGFKNIIRVPIFPRDRNSYTGFSIYKGSTCADLQLGVFKSLKQPVNRSINFIDN